MEKREKIFAPKFDPYILEQISQKRKKKYVEEDFQHFNAMDFSNMLNLVQPVTNDE
jgi:hypothetical protein